MEPEIEKLKREIKYLQDENYLLKKKIFSIVSIIEDEAEIKVKNTEMTPEEFKQINIKCLATPLRHMDLSVRSYNCLIQVAGMKTLGDLIQYSKRDLLKYKNFGKNSLTEIEQLLTQYGLELRE